METSDIKEDRARKNTRKTEDSGRKMCTEEIPASVEDVHEMNPAESMMTPSVKPSSDHTQPSISYISLIAKVLLSSPSKKLNLASIYRTMEEQFPYLRSRGPGWKNSVRHNLSVNDCFVKVGRCEDGRGHYWGVHQAHRTDFEQGNFSEYRKTKGRRERERYDEVAVYLAWVQASSFFCERRSLAQVEPLCPLQEHWGYRMLSFDWAEPLYQPWSTNLGRIQPPSGMTRYYLQEWLSHSYSRGTAVRGHDSPPVISSLHNLEMNGTVMTGMKESYDSGFMTPSGRGSRFHGCWCACPGTKEFLKPLQYRVNL